VRKEFGQDLQDDFLPEREELEIEHQLKMESSMTLQQRPDSLLRHNTDFNGILYKYDLPTLNQAIVFRSAQNALQSIDTQEQLTPTEGLLEDLACDKDTAFEAFVIKLQQKFNNEVDMYGDIKQAGDCQLKVLEFGTPIPFELL
jgi:hypothetical protein